MTYLTNYDKCGGSMGPEGKNIYMTPWPLAYENNMACEWEIGKIYLTRFLSSNQILSSNAG